MPFHITARIQGRAPLFVGLERTVARLIEEHTERSTGQLLAYAVMPNHLHLVFVQGHQPLSCLMQPLLRRLAARINGRQRTEGHVFERRFRASPCRDPDYLRNAILYVHLNAVRARLCSRADEYAWCTHPLYCSGRTSSPWERTPAASVWLFAPKAGCSPAAALANYRSFLEWRMEADAAALEAETSGRAILLPTPPRYLGGDAYWAERYGASCSRRTDAAPVFRPMRDLRDLAVWTLHEHEPEMPLDVLRSGSRTRALVAARRHFILRAKENGHRNRSIARFLNVSDVTVSRTLSCG